MKKIYSFVESLKYRLRTYLLHKSKYVVEIHIRTHTRAQKFIKYKREFITLISGPDLGWEGIG